MNEVLKAGVQFLFGGVGVGLALGFFVVMATAVIFAVAHTWKECMDE